MAAAGAVALEVLILAMPLAPKEERTCHLVRRRRKTKPPAGGGTTT